jgi:hypothetical protein
MTVFGVARLVVVLGVVAVASLGVAALASAGSGPSAGALLHRDPGKRVGGNTIVLTGNGAHGLGVHDRPNFIISLGSHEKIVGGDQNDELGALGQHDTIVAGHGGHELIHGGPNGTVVVGGSGHDLVIDKEPGTTIDLESPADEVIATGHDDHVVCSGNSVHDIIYENGSDTVNNTCHKHHDPVWPDSKAPATATSATTAKLAHTTSGPLAHTAAVTGNGTNDNPYVAPCDSSDRLQDCIVSFPARPLSGLWANEYVPAYKCPINEPYLMYTLNFAPQGTDLPAGVEVRGLGPIGVSITALSFASSPRGEQASGTLTGHTYSSATNWTTGTANYQVVLHCWGYYPGYLP